MAPSETSPYPSWARLVAAEGFVGILYETYTPLVDLGALMSFLKRDASRLGIDPARVALWSASGNAALRAGMDNWPEILSSIDHFVAYSLRENLTVTLRNYPGGDHGFDFKNDTAETRMIIGETLDFLRRETAR